MQIEPDLPWPLVALMLALALFWIVVLFICVRMHWQRRSSRKKPHASTQPSPVEEEFMSDEYIANIAAAAMRFESKDDVIQDEFFESESED